MRLFFQASVSDCSNPRICRIIDYTFILPSNPQCLLPLMDHPLCFYLTPYLSPISTHLAPVEDASLSLCTRFLPPSLAWLRNDRPPGRRSGPPVATARLRFPPMPSMAAQGVPNASRAYLPLSGCPPCRPLYLTRSLSAPGFSRTGVPSSFYLPPSTSRLLPPLPALTGVPVPCWYRVVVLCSASPFPCTSASPYPCFAPSLGVV